MPSDYRWGPVSMGSTVGPVFTLLRKTLSQASRGGRRFLTGALCKSMGKVRLYLNFWSFFLRICQKRLLFQCRCSDKFQAQVQSLKSSLWGTIRVFHQHRHSATWTPYYTTQMRNRVYYTFSRDHLPFSEPWDPSNRRDWASKSVPSHCPCTCSQPSNSPHPPR